MLKRLLLAAALLSSTYGADTIYVDPGFSLLTNRAEALVVDKSSVVIGIDKPAPLILNRLTQAKVSAVLSSTDFDVLYKALADYNEDIGCIQIIYIWLTADSTLNNGISKALDYELLRQLFWSRISLIEQLVQKMLLLPQITTEDPTGILKEQQKKLTTFSAKYDHTDITPFSKGHREKLNLLMNEYRGIYNVQPSATVE